MKLSEAIRLGAMNKPRGFGGASMATRSATWCALGAALGAIGRRVTCDLDGYGAVMHVWPFVSAESSCPACAKPTSVVEIVWHLNDIHDWPREQIADWVETVERRADAESPAMEPAKATTAASAP